MKNRKTAARWLWGLRLGGAAALLVLALCLRAPAAWPRAALSAAAWALAGCDVLWRCLRNILRGRIFDENFLMTLASAGAFALGEYTEAVAVILFYQVGELFQKLAVGRSRRSIAALTDIRPDTANRVGPEGGVAVVDAQDVLPGDLILVRPGERVPLDGVVDNGESALDTASLTGESVPRPAGPGDEILSGCVNLTGALRLRVTRGFYESTASRILDLVENAGEKKAPAEQFITKFARYYTPAVVLTAAALAVLPPLFWGGWQAWIYRALTFLVVSCPCALVISVPMGFFGGLGCASGQGVLIKGGNYLEALAHVETAVFDKTGTLTRGTLRVARCVPAPGVQREELLRCAALAEACSTHPIAAALREAYGKPVSQADGGVYRECAGKGVRAQAGGIELLAGNARLMEEAGLKPDAAADGTVIHVAADGRYQGYVELADALRPDAADALRALKKLGVRRTVMLTGDAPAAAAQAARALGVDQMHAGLLPADKVERVEALLAEGKGKLLFVGDGINDAPVLARADVGAAMGGLGADAAIEAADVVIMTDQLSKLPLAIRIARRTGRIVRQNIVFALAVKAAVLVLGAAGLASMWDAVFADVGVSVLAVLNAMRALRAPADKRR